MNKVASTGRMQDLNPEFDPEDDPAYHTYHPGEDPAKRTMRKLPRSPRWKEGDSDTDSTIEDHSGGCGKQRSRFRVQKVVPPSTSVVKVRNKFDILNSSLHDDPTPIKERALDYRPRKGPLPPPPHAGFNNGDTTGTESEFDESQGSATPSGSEGLSRKGRRQLKFGHVVRSKSTSPTRMGEAAKKKAIFKTFNPDKADWIQKKS